ncbi:MAG: hypothetical protein ACREHG_02435, partial [Candidatus Saccharimonadales bacterium]
HIEEYAAKALDISPDQAATLFYLDNISQVEVAVKYLADNPAVKGEDLWNIVHFPAARARDED